MAVYVDNMYAKYGRMKMCHMLADDSRELHHMAGLIGIGWRWLQNEGTYKEHADKLKERRIAVLEAKK